MDQNEKKMDTGELLLNEILKEFGNIAPAEDEDVRIWDGVIPADAKAPQLPEDTVRLDDVVKAVAEVPAAESSQQTIRFTPPAQPDAPQPPQPPVPEKAEPYSEKWEPEYEQPIRDYIPPEPIVFRPKSRLRELKRKLIEGPEKRFYELEELGLGKLQTATFLNILVTLAAIAGVAAYQFGFVGEDRMRLLVFSQVFCLLMSGLLGSYQLMDGIGDIFRRKHFSLNTSLLISFLACAADAVLCLLQLRVPFCAVFCLHMTMSLSAAHQKRSTETAQMDTMRKATRLDSLVLSEDYYEGKPGYLRGEGQVEDFMDHYDAPSGPEKVLSVYALIALLLSIGCGVAAGVLYSLSAGLLAFSTALMVCVPVSTHVALSRPMSLLQRRLKKHGSVICGWQGVVGLSRKAAFPLTDTDLFPSGSAKMNGVKFYGDRDPDEIVAYATAVICGDGGSMAPLMSQLLDSRCGYHYDASDLRSYPGGVGGIVEGEAVLAGTLTFMQNMGVEMPKGTKVNQAVYVAIDGQLCGVFAVTYAKIKSSAVGLTSLCSYRNLTPVMVTGDFMLTESFLRAKFGVNTKHMAFPHRNVRTELAQKEADPDIVALAMTTQEGLAGMAYAVTGSRALRSSCIAGTVVHMAGGILGLAIVGALIAVNALELLTPGNILLYQLIWMIPGWLISEWTRSV